MRAIFSDEKSSITIAVLLFAFYGKLSLKKPASKNPENFSSNSFMRRKLPRKNHSKKKNINFLFFFSVIYVSSLFVDSLNVGLSLRSKCPKLVRSFPIFFQTLIPHIFSSRFFLGCFFFRRNFQRHGLAFSLCVFLATFFGSLCYNHSGFIIFKMGIRVRREGREGKGRK